MNANLWLFLELKNLLRNFDQSDTLSEFDLELFIHCGVATSQSTMINQCDRDITLLSDTDVFFGLFNLFTYLDMPFGAIVSNTLNVKQILKIYLLG